LIKGLPGSRHDPCFADRMLQVADPLDEIVKASPSRYITHADRIIE
jgi:hypothetical protein